MPQKTTLLAGIRIEDVLNEKLRREMDVEEDQKTGHLTLSQRLSHLNERERLSQISQDLRNAIFDLSRH